jgi:phage terminase large subunit
MKIELSKKQKEVFLSNADVILYGGAVGGGKSFLMRALSIIYALSIPNINIYLFRRHSGEIFNTHFTGNGSYYDLLSEYISAGLVKITTSPAGITFKNGSRIICHHCQDKRALSSVQGIQADLLLIDEATQFPEEFFTYLLSRLRSVENETTVEALKELGETFNTKMKLPRCICSANPDGIGKTYFKKTFIDPSPAGKIFKNDAGMTLQYVPATLNDNKYIDSDSYIQKLMSLPKELRQAYINGDWNVVIGGTCFGDIFRTDVHVVEKFKIPNAWKLYRSMDWGFKDKSAILWYAVSNGEDYYDGNWNTSKKGDVFLIAELVVNKVAPEMLAKRIKKIDAVLKRGGRKIYEEYSPADTQIWNVTDGSSIYDKMKDYVKFKKANKGPGSRKAGVLEIRQRLMNALTNDGPGLYIFENNVNIIGDIMNIPRDSKDPLDVDTNSPFDHTIDSLRYFLNQKKNITESKPIILG